MADLRIVDAPEIPTENITGEEKLPTGGNGNYSISLDSLADYTKTKKDLADNTSVDGKVNGVRQELNAHTQDLLNPHQVTKDQIGLGNVDNTADADKPVSNSAQAAIISAVSPKSDKTYVDNQLALKANKTDVYTKQESSDLVNNSISTALAPVNTSLDLAKRGIANLYDPALVYNSGERVVLANGDIVKSTIDGNANNPNVDMIGWEFSNSPNSIITVNSVAEMLSLRVFDGLTVRTKSYNAPNLALANPYHGGMTYVYDSSRSGENDSGSVINGWVAIFPNNQVVNVDWFGADPTNTIDSTNAVLAAIQCACGDLTSNFKAGVTKRAAIEYSAGIYMQGDIPIISCCTYKGQGKFSTQIIPSDTAQWVFKSVGSYEGATISGDTRVIYSSIKEMTIGYGYVSSVPRVNNSAGGIYREAGSWNQIENVAILGLGGNGLKLIGDFDSDFNYLTIMSVGSSGFPALVIDRSQGSNDGSNAMSFRRLHIEGCYQHFYIGRNSRHIWFDWAKFEHCSVSSVIEDHQGVVFDNLECSVSQSNFPWIDVIASSNYSPFVIEFNNPMLIGVGWLINNTTNFKVNISGGSGRRVNKLATGRHCIIRDFYAFDSGAQMIDLAYSKITGCSFMSQRTTAVSDGTADMIILRQAGNEVSGCVFDGQVPAGADNSAFINISASPTAKVFGNTFGVGRQYAMRGNSSINQRDNTYAYTAFTGTNTRYTSLLNTNDVGLNSRGGIKSVGQSVAPDSTGTIVDIIGGASTLTIRDSNIAIIAVAFADASGRINIVMQNGTQTALLGTGVSGDGKIYLRASGTSLVVENRTTSQLNLTVLSHSAI